MKVRDYLCGAGAVPVPCKIESLNPLVFRVTVVGQENNTAIVTVSDAELTWSSRRTVDLSDVTGVMAAVNYRGNLRIVLMLKKDASEVKIVSFDRQLEICIPEFDLDIDFEIK